jgi:large subunit ribosomal protein L19
MLIFLYTLKKNLSFFENKVLTMKAKIYTKETINQFGISDRALPAIEVGDTVAVMLKVKEGNKERLQKFEGDIIAIKNNGASSTFTVRKIASGGIAVERIFPFYTPVIDSIKVLKKGNVRRAKLYYVRGREGKKARIEEKVLTRAQKEQRELANDQSVQENTQDEVQAEE